jgi:protein required for attachment to host cells
MERGIVQWVVVADNVEARIWSRRANVAPTLVEVLAHAVGHLREQDIVSDRPGRMRADGRGHMQAMKQRGSARHTERARFGATVAARLARGLQERAWDELVIVAAPRWLGELREHLDDGVRQRVVLEVHHSLMHARIEDLCERIDTERRPSPPA